MLQKILSVSLALLLAAVGLELAAGTAQGNAPADVVVTLPADATLWAQGTKLPGSGTTRRFRSPLLQTGHRYAYDFQASWKEDGRTVTQKQTVYVSAGKQVTLHFQERSRAQPASRVYEGRIKDVRPAWGFLILTVGKGKEARDLGFNISQARIVGPSGAEWKGQDFQAGDPALVEMTANGTLVQQVSILPDRARGRNKMSR
jgi:uncharacterized protein (TIGR03000 family)